MPRVAPVVPAETDILCEGCGYTLNGLPPIGNCPECGKPISQTIDPQLRFAPAWESAESNRLWVFLQTTAQIIFRPTRFFRTINARGPVNAARVYAQWNWLSASWLFGGAAAGHFVLQQWLEHPWLLMGMWLICVVLCLLLLIGVTHLATRLTAWEAAYRGFRLPHQTVLRGMYYHSAHYLPVASLALLTVFGYRWLIMIGFLSITSLTYYLYLLSAEVIVSAIYLFHTYWIGMRNMMYANR